MSEEAFAAHRAKRAAELARQDGHASNHFANSPPIVCAHCWKETPRVGPVQKYCEPCSDLKNDERKAKWAKEHPRIGYNYDAVKQSENLRRQRGAERNAVERERYGIGPLPDLSWLVRVAVPFHNAVSKNHIYSSAIGGHRFLRRESKEFRNALTLTLRLALGTRVVVANKVWLDIYVEKPHHKMDAVNVVDLVCDGVKEALEVDDRWFCIRRLDWQIVKSNPRIFVGVGQEDVEASQVCSYCGAIRPMAEFGKHATSSSGKHRICKLCSSLKSEMPHDS